MNEWCQRRTTLEAVWLRTRPPTLFPLFLDPGSNLLICLYYNLMNAQRTSVSSTLRVIRNGPHCYMTFLTQLLPPNLIIFNGTATSVITGKSCASPTFSSCAWGEYVGVSAGNLHILIIFATTTQACQQACTWKGSGQTWRQSFVLSNKSLKPGWAKEQV